jgi:hypothetical protein
MPSPYTFTGTQTYLVGTGADVAVIDPGPDGTGAPAMPTPGEGHVEAIMQPWEARAWRPSSAPTPTATTARPRARSRR